MRSLVADRGLRWPVLGLGALLGGLGLWRLLLLVQRIAQTLPHPFQFDPTEGILLTEFAWILQRRNIYAPFTADSFLSAPYPPVYYALATPIMRWTGMNFWAGRSIALAATLLIALLLSGLVTRHVNRWWGVLAALLWLVSLPTLVWATRLKPDLVAVAFALAGVWLADGWHNQAFSDQAQGWRLLRSRRLWLVVGAITLGFYSKQSAIAGGLAIGLWLLRRDWRQGVVYGVVQALALMIPFALLDLLTQHGFWIHMIDYHELPWSPRRWLGIVRDLTLYHWALSMLSVVFVATHLRRWNLLALYSVIALLATFSGGTFGGFHNHALELLAVLCLGAALGTAWLMQQWQRWLGLAALALLVVQIYCFRFVPAWLAYELGNLPNPQTTQRLIGIQNLVRAQPGEVWGDNMGLIVMAGKPVRFNDPLIMAAAAQLGWWDETTFTRLVREGHFDLVLWRNDVLASKRPNDLSPAQYAALRDRYRVRFRDVLLVYEP